MTVAGRILIMPKGDFNSSTTYEMLDVVYYGGTSWIAKTTVSGVVPSTVNSEYWQKLFDIDAMTEAIIDEKVRAYIKNSS